MELIVKIGADQQGLDETLQRITQNFRTMETSMPSSWMPNKKAMDDYGHILKKSEQVADSFGDVAVQSLSRKATSFLKGMVLGSLTSMLLEGLQSVNKMFWENFYNSGEETMNRMAALSDRIGGAVSNLKSARAVAQARREREMSPHDLAAYLIGQRGQMEGSVAKAQAEYDAAHETAADLRSGKATHLNGSKFTDYERQGAFIKETEAEVRLLEAREKLAQLNDRISTAVEQDKKQTEAAIAAQFGKDKPGKELKSVAEDNPLHFQADAMAQAGLFTGSSLLYNPNFTVQQEQLQVLRAIHANIEQIEKGPFT